MRGLSPKEYASRVENSKAVKNVDRMLQTIKSQDRHLPEYLRKQREEVERNGAGGVAMVVKEIIPKNIGDTS
jgi:hypothetical protein